MLVVIDNKNEGVEKMIKKWKNKVEKTQLLKILRLRRFFVKAYISRAKKASAALYKKRKSMSEDA